MHARRHSSSSVSWHPCILPCRRTNRLRCFRRESANEKGFQRLFESRAWPAVLARMSSLRSYSGVLWNTAGGRVAKRVRCRYSGNSHRLRTYVLTCEIRVRCVSDKSQAPGTGCKLSDGVERCRARPLAASVQLTSTLIAKPVLLKVNIRRLRRQMLCPFLTTLPAACLQDALNACTENTKLEQD